MTHVTQSEEEQEMEVRTVLTDVAKSLRIGAQAAADHLTRAGLHTECEPWLRRRYGGRPDLMYHAGSFRLAVAGIGVVCLSPEAWIRGTRAELRLSVSYQASRDRIAYQQASGSVTRRDFTPELPRSVEGLSLGKPEPIDTIVVDVREYWMRLHPDIGLQVELEPPERSRGGQVSCQQEDVNHFLLGLSMRALGLQTKKPLTVES